jgi:hypothetical protein
MKWPPKREGACSNAPIPKLTGLALDNSGHSFAQPCAHPATRTERLPDGHLHFARLRCVLCDRHSRWLPRPETIERRTLNSFKPARLAMCEGLSSWERRFVGDVLKLAKLSPRQQVLVARFYAQYLEGAP